MWLTGTVLVQGQGRKTEVNASSHPRNGSQKQFSHTHRTRCLQKTHSEFGRPQKQKDMSVPCAGRNKPDRRFRTFKPVFIRALFCHTVLLSSNTLLQKEYSVNSKALLKTQLGSHLAQQACSGEFSRTISSKLCCGFLTLVEHIICVAKG
jgi:hypothetical protein